MKDFLCLSCCYRWTISLQRKTTKVKWLELQVVIDGHLLRNNRPMAAPIRAGFPTRLQKKPTPLP